MIQILGTDQFYWDADNIYIYDTSEPLNQIRIGRYDGTNYGIGFTEDGGSTWQTAIGFDGTHIGSDSNIDLSAGGSITLSSSTDLTFGTDTLADLLATAGATQTTIFYQTSAPTAIATGDIWYDTDAVPVTIKRWNGSSWVDITTTALSQALTAAGDAQATADGKIKAWAQTSAPTASATGDLWIDTDDNNKMYRWSGAAWVLYKVASGYVATSKITIDNDGIDIASTGEINLVGASINVDGTSSIDISSGGSLNLSSASQITIGTSPMEVGGTNLIAGSGNTQAITQVYGVTGTESTGSDPTLPAGEYWRISGIARTNGNYVWLIPLKAVSPSYGVTTGGTFALSFWMKANAPMTLLVVGNDQTVISHSDTSVTTAYKRFTLLIKPNTVRGSAANYNTHVLLTGSGLTDVYVYGIKLEKGNIATDWSPSPEDTTNAIASAVSGRTTIWYQTAQPTATETGDLWYDTDANPVTIKRWNGSSWVDITTTALSQALSAAGTAQATADGKIKAWAQTSAPTASATGDLWVDTDDNNKLYRWSGSAWTLYKVASGYVATSKITIDNSGIAMATGGTFTVGSSNFAIDASGNVEMKGAVTANTGYIGGTGGFTITTGKLYSGKTTLTGTDAGVYIGTDGISLGSAGVAPQFKVTSSGALTASGVTISGKVTATTGTIGDFTLSSGHMVHSDSGNDYFMDLSKWGLAIGEDANTDKVNYPQRYWFPFKAYSHFDSVVGHMVCTHGRIGALDFAPDAVIIKTPNTVYSGTRESKIIFYPATASILAPGGFHTSTPGYKGMNALDELKVVKNDSKGDIDHSTLPPSVRGKAKIPAVKEKDEKGGIIIKEAEHEIDTCNLGMLALMLVKAIQELDARLGKLEAINGKKI